MYKSGKNNKKRGFLLLEVAITLVVVSISITALLVLQGKLCGFHAALLRAEREWYEQKT